MPPKKYKYEDRQQLIGDITALSIDQQKEIFKIFHKNKIPYTENTNGIYIMMDNVKDKVLKEIDIFIKFCKEKNEQLKKEEEQFQTEREKFLGDKYQEEQEGQPDTDGFMQNRYMAKETYQTDLSKYNLDLDEEETKLHDENKKEDIVLNKNKPQYGGIRAKIIKGK